MLRVSIALSISLFLACSSDSPPPTGPAYSAGKALATESAQDRQALNNVYEVLANAAGQDIQWLKDGRWTSRSTVAKWYGVTVEDRRVVEIVFEWTKSRHTTINKPIFQELVQALSPLTELRRVYINFQTSGVTDSPEKWNQHYQALHSRTWPAEIANLSKLEYISIHGQPTNFTGPATQLKSIKQATVSLPVDPSFWTMTQLEELSITSFKIARATEKTILDELLTWKWESQIEVPAEISQLINLKKLNIGSDGHSDVVISLPETITQLSQLEELTIGPSTIQLPTNLSALTNLQYLKVTGHGQLPASWSQLASLRELHIYSPQTHFWYGVGPYGNAGITRDDYDGYIYGPLPAEWSDLSNLEVLSVNIDEVGYLNGELPAEWNRLSKLQAISFPNHEFEGSLPAEWGQMTQLKYIDLSNNLFEGSLPAEWGQLTQLKHLYLNNNSFEGPIPSEWCQMIALEKLSLSNNALSGTIPSQIDDLTSLKALSLSNNQFSGPLVDFSEMQSLEYISLSGNQLSGSINGRHFPTSIIGIGIADNNLVGKFPNLRHLGYLRSFNYHGNAVGLNVGRSTICPRIPQSLKETGFWGCDYDGTYIYSEGSS